VQILLIDYFMTMHDAKIKILSCLSPSSQLSCEELDVVIVWHRGCKPRRTGGNGEVSQEIRDLCFDLRKKGIYKRAVTSINVDNESLDLTFLEAFD